MSDTIKIYVACLAAYNNGLMHGAWLELDNYSDADDLKEAIEDVLDKSPIQGAEEYAVHDYDTPLYNMNKSDHPNLSELLELQQALDKHGWKVVDTVLGAGCDLDHCEDVIKLGKEPNAVKDYLVEIWIDCNEVPEHVYYYLDEQAIARDVRFDYHVEEHADYSCSVICLHT